MADPRKIPDFLRQLLPRVQGPGQYAGGEPNSVVKSAAATKLRFALAFPDAYAVGMSHHGSRILYDILNRMDGVACERAYAPFPDFEAQLRQAGRRLYSLETFKPLAEFDALGFSLSYEMCATALLNILDLGGIPLTRFERGLGCPLVLAGGHAAFNPEPFSDFVDVFLIGEGEDQIRETAAILLACKGDHEAALLRLAREVEGAYVPAFYETEETSAGLTVVARALRGAPERVRRRVVRDFAAAPSPERPIVPVFQTVHERVTVEVMRGCPNGCRFCQAGVICRPVRARPVEQVLATARETYRRTGYDEVGLLSLSTSDHPCFDRLVAELDREFSPRGVSLSLPSLRVDHELWSIPERVKSVRKSALTVAPEAGTDRLRAVINKDVTNDNLLAAAEEAFRQGWQGIKMYFMAGLPTETDADAEAIAALANAAARLRKRSFKRHPVNVSLSNFVPKPHTPFQWEPMAAPATLSARHALVARGLDRKRVALKTHDLALSRLEGLLARGDRKLGRAILLAYRAGARLDGWSDHFRPELWDAACAAAGVDPARYLDAARDETAPQPWSHIDCGVQTDFLRRERERAFAGVRTPRCAPGSCAGCGAEGCAYRDGPA